MLFRSRRISTKATQVDLYRPDGTTKVTYPASVGINDWTISEYSIQVDNLESNNWWIKTGANPGTKWAKVTPWHGRFCFLTSTATDRHLYPYHIQDNMGRIHIAAVLNGNVIYYRADQTVADNGWATHNTVTSFGDVVSATMDIDPQLNRIHLLVTRKTAGVYSVYILYSDDDGATFTSGTLLMASALGAFVWKQDISAMGYTWFVYNSGTSGDGVQQAKFSPGSGQAFGATFTFKDSSGNPIQVADQGWANVQEAKDNRNALTWTPILKIGRAHV